MRGSSSYILFLSAAESFVRMNLRVLSKELDELFEVASTLSWRLINGGL